MNHVFVSKLNPVGASLIYSTLLGGTSTDYGYGIAVDANGNASVTGQTDSTDFPTTSDAFQSRFGGSYDAFVTTLNLTGSSLIYSTYLGGTALDYGDAIAMDSNGYGYLTGTTASTDFPVTDGSFQSNLAGSDDVFVAKIALASGVTPTSTSTATATLSATSTSTETPTMTPTMTATTTPTSTPTPTATNSGGGGVVSRAYLPEVPVLKAGG